MVKMHFDADKVEPIGVFEPLPIGEYLVTMTKTSGPSPSKKNPDNKYIQVEFTVIDGKYKNRVIFDFLNVINTNDKAVEIAQKKLSAITRSVGVHQIQEDMDELKGKPLVLKLGIRKGTDGFDDQNDIKEYKTATGKSLQTNAIESSTSEPTQKMPWEK